MKVFGSNCNCKWIDEMMAMKKKMRGPYLYPRDERAVSGDSANLRDSRHLPRSSTVVNFGATCELYVFLHDRVLRA